MSLNELIESMIVIEVSWNLKSDNKDRKKYTLKHNKWSQKINQV